MISVVVPAFTVVLSPPLRLGKDEFELLIVEDGSRDRTLEICGQLGAADPRLKVNQFLPQFRHQAAVSAGLMHARGNIVAVMDADLQDPPEELLFLHQQNTRRLDVVYAIRTRTKGEPHQADLLSRVLPYPQAARRSGHPTRRRRFLRHSAEKWWMPSISFLSTNDSCVAFAPWVGFARPA